MIAVASGQRDGEPPVLYDVTVHAYVGGADLTVAAGEDVVLRTREAPGAVLVATRGVLAVPEVVDGPIVLRGLQAGVTSVIVLYADGPPEITTVEVRQDTTE